MKDSRALLGSEANETLLMYSIQEVKDVTVVWSLSRVRLLTTSWTVTHTDFFVLHYLLEFAEIHVH